MDLDECKRIVEAFFRDVGFLEHRDNKQLKVDGHEYRIQPDDVFRLSDKIVVIEYEKNARPVESISKYWWLFRRSSWLNCHVSLRCLVLLINDRINPIRIESVQILGDELAKQYNSVFEFRFLRFDEVSKENIESMLRELAK